MISRGRRHVVGRRRDQWGTPPVDTQKQQHDEQIRYMQKLYTYNVKRQFNILNADNGQILHFMHTVVHQNHLSNN